MCQNKVLLCLAAFLAVTWANPAPYRFSLENIDEDVATFFDDAESTEGLHPAALTLVDHLRLRRSVQPGAPNFPVPGGNDGWKVTPDVRRDDAGNTRTSVNVQHTGPSHDVEAGWGKVVRGPNKAKPTWHATGTFKW